MPQPSLSRALIAPDTMTDAEPVHEQLWRRRFGAGEPEWMPRLDDAIGPGERDRLNEILRLFELFRGLGGPPPSANA